MTEGQTLNQKVDYLVSTIESFKKILEKQKENLQIPENLNLEGAITFLNCNGYTISKSSIYKLTSKKSIPFKRFGNRLVFVRSELEQWGGSQLSQISNDEIKFLSRSASKKLTKKTS